MQSRFSLLFLPSLSRSALFKFVPQLSAALVSTSSHALLNNEGKPPSSGERGRRNKNYKRGQQRKEREKVRKEAKPVDTHALLEGMKKMEGQRDTQHKTSMEALKDLLSGIKIHVPSNADTRKRMGMFSKSTQSRSGKEEARLSSERAPEHSMYPSAGPRLGIFNIPGPNVNVMPPAPPNPAKEDLQSMLASMRWLKPTNPFEHEMTDIRYPRQFPIDNEAANIEDGGFEDHVLLNHLLKGFPTRGPVRHFMEMVVTGLSKNAHYTAQEKRDYVQWYSDYFSKFTDEELQTLTNTTSIPAQSLE